MTKKFTSVEEYIASFPEKTRKALEEVRAIIKSVTPDAVENISYQIAAFRVNGKNYVSRFNRNCRDTHQIWGCEKG